MRRILHLDEKVGDDVSDADIVLARSSYLHARCLTQQLKLHTLRRFPPGVRNGKRLFPDRSHQRTIRQNHGSGRFELSLTTDRASLPIEGNQNERAGRSSSQLKRRRLYDYHGEPL